MDLIQERCERKLENLIKRENERKGDLEKGQALKKLTNAENEQLDYFQKSFNERKLKIESDLNKASDLQSNLAEHFDTISKDILNLQKYLATSNLFLRGYDVKIYQKILENLGNRAKELEDILLPKKKFGFKSKRSNNQLNGKEKLKCKIESSIDEVDSVIQKHDLINESNKSFTLNPIEIYKKDIALSNLTNCHVNILGSPSTLHLNNLNGCKIITGPVSTSIFAANCFNSTLIIACQQLRLHNSENLKIHLHVTSRAIMEDCNEILLAPYTFTYDGIDEDFIKAGLNRSINNWTSIDDFNWLNVERPSPHWRRMSDSECCD